MCVCTVAIDVLFRSPIAKKKISFSRCIIDHCGFILLQLCLELDVLLMFASHKKRCVLSTLFRAALLCFLCLKMPGNKFHTSANVQS